MAAAITRGLRSQMKYINSCHGFKFISTSLHLNGMIVVKNPEEFVEKVMQSKKPVIVNFHAEWCDPCKILTPQLKEKISSLDTIDLAIVDVEENPELVHTFEVKAVPAVIAIKNGSIIDKFIGLVDEQMIDQLINKIISKNSPEQ